MFGQTWPRRSTVQNQTRNRTEIPFGLAMDILVWPPLSYVHDTCEGSGFIPSALGMHPSAGASCRCRTFLAELRQRKKNLCHVWCEEPRVPPKWCTPQAVKSGEQKSGSNAKRKQNRAKDQVFPTHPEIFLNSEII